MEMSSVNGEGIWIKRASRMVLEKGDDESVPLNRSQESKVDVDGTADDPQKRSKLIFGIKDTPPIHIIMFYVIQVLFNSIVGPITTAYLVFKSVCADGQEWLYARIISTSLFSCGVCTIMQVLVGVRLPIFQGSSLLYVTVITAIFSAEEWRCPEKTVMNGSVIYVNTTAAAPVDLEPWNIRIATVSGNLAIASILHILLGATGLVGALMNFVGPLTLAPVIGMIGLCLYDAIIIGARHQWGVVLFVIAAALVMAIVMENVNIPMPVYNSGKGFGFSRMPILKMFASIFALVLGCLLCYILTVSGVLPDDPEEIGYYARTDAKLDALGKAPWFFFPYPGQYGPLQAQIGQSIAFIPVILGSVIESIADYAATALACQVPRPPNHAINRGIAIEGIGSVVGAVIGACHGTTSYSNQMGLIAYSGVGSRIVWLSSGITLLVAGVCGKFGAILALVPDPVISGLLVLALAMCYSMAMESLNPVDMSSSRNQMVLGLAMVLGLCVPIYVQRYQEALHTGIAFIDQVSVTCLSSAILVGGFTGFLLDNLLPGTKASRGIRTAEEIPISDMKIVEDIYSLPLPKSLNNIKLFRYLPFLPCYRGINIGPKCCSKAQASSADRKDVIIIEEDAEIAEIITT